MSTNRSLTSSWLRLRRRWWWICYYGDNEILN